MLDKKAALMAVLFMVLAGLLVAGFGHSHLFGKAVKRPIQGEITSIREESAPTLKLEGSGIIISMGRLENLPEYAS
jgi:hypothetical protein